MKTKLETLINGTAGVIPADGLTEKLKLNRPLTIKLGMDPTAPDLHLGHAVVLRKMRDFQDQGHRIIFLIGDFTAYIGDPTGKSKTRPALSADEIADNTKTYFEQVGRILDLNTVEIRYNSEWLGKLTSYQLVQLCAKVTVARLLERDDFSNRLAAQQSISFHELLYPLMQGYDSVVLEADVELGGTDQTFNLLMGRFLQEQYVKAPQVVMTTPLLEGLDGVQKMSKSLGNAIGLNDTPDQAFGKLMSISDQLMWRYAAILLKWPEAALTEKQRSVQTGTIHPMEMKKEIATGIVASFWSPETATAARGQFETVFQEGDLSQATVFELPADTENSVWIVDLLRMLDAVSSSSEAKRLIENGAVHVDGCIISEFKATVTWHEGSTVKVGKHKLYRLKKQA